MAVTFAMLQGNEQSNIAFVNDEEGYGLEVVWCRCGFLTGMIIRRGDGTFTDEMFDSYIRLLRE